MAIAGLVCATSTLAWVFQIIILAESYFIVDTLLGLRVEDVHVGPAVILGVSLIFHFSPSVEALSLHRATDLRFSATTLRLGAATLSFQ